VAALFNAQVLYTLPVSLFGMSVSAAELPAMAGIVAADTEVAGVLRDRLHRALGDIAYFVVPSAVAFLALGDVVAGAVLQTGRFTAADADYVWGILAGSSVGLLASTMGRLYNSTFYALRDTRTPLRFAIVRVVVATALGWFGAVRMGWGAPAITGASGIAAWLEFALLKRSLSARIGKSGAGLSLLAKLWICAAVAAGLAFAAKQLVAGLNPVVVGASVLGVYGVVYFGATAIIGISQARAVSRRLLRR
jgi:putative peptidoglycan lipid II flippase